MKEKTIEINQKEYEQIKIKTKINVYVIEFKKDKVNGFTIEKFYNKMEPDQISVVPVSKHSLIIR